MILSDSSSCMLILTRGLRIAGHGKCWTAQPAQVGTYGECGTQACKKPLQRKNSREKNYGVYHITKLIIAIENMSAIVGRLVSS